MTIELAQDLVVTCVALFAAFVVLRRVFAFVRPGKAAGGCASCGSASTSCATAAQSAQSAPGAGQAQVIHVLRAPAVPAASPHVRDRVGH